MLCTIQESCSTQIHAYLESKSNGHTLVPGYLIKARDKYQIHKYWMYFTVPLFYDLSMIDQFFRDVWVECCDHRSDFILSNKTTHQQDMIDQNLMHQRLVGRDLHPESVIEYVYDWGTSTRLVLEVVPGVIECPPEHITILIQNVLTKSKCKGCSHMNAEQICSYCGGTFCQPCSERHECLDDSFLPIVNSPRAGLCGYTGVEKHCTLPY